MTADDSVSGPNFRDDVVLEDALQQVVCADARTGNVVDAEGTVLGSVHIDQIIAGIARPKVDRGGVEGNGEARYK